MQLGPQTQLVQENARQIEYIQGGCGRKGAGGREDGGGEREEGMGEEIRGKCVVDKSAGARGRGDGEGINSRVWLRVFPPLIKSLSCLINSWFGVVYVVFNYWSLCLRL